MAALLVFLSHTSVGSVFPGRFGVTVFFFLSGYLITTLMRREMAATGRLHLKGFYLRRIIRIFPPLYLVLAFVLVLIATGVLDSQTTVAGAASQFLHFSNYYLIFNDEAALLPGTIVTWSLAVEEHFYIVFPLIFVALTTRMSSRRVARALLACCLIVLLWRCLLIYGTSVPREYAFMASEARIDSIIFGVIMGLWRNPMMDRALEISEAKQKLLLALALSVLVIALLINNETFSYTFRYSIQGVALFPVFYLAVSRPDWLIFRPLNVAAMRGMGFISYTFYLCHMVFIFIADDLIENQAIRIGFAFGMSVGFSTIMYFMVEKKLAGWRRRLRSGETGPGADRAQVEPAARGASSLRSV